ncbi:MAG: chemotaxis protein CheA [Oligoflexus sp.]
MDEFLSELRRTFLLEAQELLEHIENNLVRVRPGEENQDLIEALFRDFHTLKGNSRSVNYNEIADLTHKIENILTQVKLGEIQFTEQVIDGLLEAKDALQQDFEVLASGAGPIQNHEDLMRRIDQSCAEVHAEDESENESMDLTHKGIPMKSMSEMDEKYSTKIEIPTLETEQVPSEGFTLFDDDSLAENPALIEEGTGELTEKIEGMIPAAEQPILGADLHAKTKFAQISDNDEANSGVLKDEYLRVPLSKVNQLVALSREQAGLLSILEHMSTQGKSNSEDIIHQINQLVDQTYQLQKVAISLRMVTLETIQAKLQRVVHDTCKLTQKKVQLKVSGSSTEVEKGILDPLVHMVRNAIDHGIEDPTARLKAKKPELGTISIHTYAKGGFVFIEFSDDGAGLNREAILAKAKKIRLVRGNGADMPDWQVYQLLFASGFSTKEQVTEVSGRGVGMDVVRSEVSRLNGRIDIRSHQGQGTSFTIRLPLPIATFNGVLVSVGSHRYILPNSEIEAIHSVEPKDIIRVDSKRNIIDLGKESLTLVRLLDESEQKMEDGKKLCILQVSIHSKKFGILVDEVQESRKFTYKKLGTELDDLPGVSGGAVLGDGKVCLILNATDLIETAFQMAA